MEPKSYTAEFFFERTESGYWVDFDLTTNSTIEVTVVGEPYTPSDVIFNASGTRFTQTHILLDYFSNLSIFLDNSNSFPISVSGGIWIRHYVMTDVAVTKYRLALNPTRLTYGILTAIIGVVIVAVGSKVYKSV